MSLDMFPAPGEVYDFFLSFIIAGMVAGAIPSLAAAFTSYSAYLFCALVPLAIHMLREGDALAYTFVVLIVVFGVFMLLSARAYNRTLWSSLTLRYQNEDLAAAMRAESTRVRTLNEELAREIEHRTNAQSELVRAKESAEAASIAKSAFVANMSHEIRTPMNGVLGMIELLSQSKLDAQQLGFVEVARTSTESLLQVINSILDFSKIESGKIELEYAPFDLRRLCEEVTALFTANAQQAGVELICFVAPEVSGRVIGDATRMRQILTNLVGNAVKFTHGGEVSLWVQQLQRSDDRLELQFEIRDSGIGMTEEQVKSLFSAFQQADASMTRRYGGTGLGLAITRRLIKLMGGEIDVSSEPGRGSCFRVRLGFQPFGEGASDTRTARLERARALVVDDNATNLEIVSRYLQGWGVAHEEAASAKSAFERLRVAHAAGQPFDLVLTDMQMPGASGLDLADWIKQDKGLQNTRLILLSSLGNLSRADLAEHGIAASVVKPVRYSQLKEVLCMALDPSPEAPVRSEGPLPGPGLSGRVLLVEDNLVNQKVAMGLLRKLGLEVDLAVDGEVALQRCADTAYDMVLMDVQMPRLDGISATRALRESEREADDDRHVPIVAMTANAEVGDREDCLAAGMDDYLPKPFTRAMLEAKLQRWLKPAEIG
jgi:signal transduction histidine kinase/CheY-like chemotaxis protein